MRKIILIFAFGFGLLLSNQSSSIARENRPCEKDVCEAATGHCKYTTEWYSCAQIPGGCKERQCAE